MFRVFSPIVLCAALHVASLEASGQANPPWLIPVETRTETVQPVTKGDPNPGQLEMSPDGRWIGVHDGSIYRRNQTNGTLTLVHRTDPADSAAGLPYFGPESRYFYVLRARRVIVSAIDDSGRVTAVQTVSDTKNDEIVGLSYPDSCLITPDGHHFYAEDGQNQTLVCFQRDPETGKLSYVECLQDDSADRPLPGAPRAFATVFPTAIRTDGVGLVQTMASTPDGKQVLMGVGEENRLVIFDRNTKTGRLSLVSTVKQHPVKDLNGVSQVLGIAFAGKGEHFVTASLTGGVSLFERDPAVRKPTFIEVFWDDRDVNPNDRPIYPWLRYVKDLKNPEAVVFVPKHSAFIVTSTHDHALHAFRFDSDGPSLKWMGRMKEGENGITGLYKVRDLAVSPDGRFLYAASANATVAVFEIKL